MISFIWYFRNCKPNFRDRCQTIGCLRSLEEGGKMDFKGAQRMFEDEKCMHYFDCGDGFIDAYICQTHESNTLNTTI